MLFVNRTKSKTALIETTLTGESLYLITAEHEHEGENEEGEEGETYDHFDFMEMAEETDETLRNYDENNDGYIHYGEFYRNHKKTLDSASKTPGAGG